MVAVRSSNRTVLPITDLSPFNVVVQNRCVSTGGAGGIRAVVVRSEQAAERPASGP